MAPCDRGRKDRLRSRSPLPPNRTCGSPAYGSPVGGSPQSGRNSPDTGKVGSIPMPDNRPTRSIHLPDGKQSAYRRGRARLHKSFSGRFSPQALNLPVELSDSIRAISTFLRSLRSTGVTRLLCYYGRSDSCRAIVSRVASVGLLRVAPTRTYGRAVWMWSAQHHLVPSRFLLSRQVSLLTAIDLLTIPSSTTKLPFPHRGFRTLPQPDRLPRRSPGQTSEGRWDCRHAVRGSPLASRLPDWLGRIRFVILRTGRSPPVASHLSSRRRSYFRLQVRNVNLVGTFTPPINRLQRRTSQGRKSLEAEKPWSPKPPTGATGTETCLGAERAAGFQSRGGPFPAAPDGAFSHCRQSIPGTCVPGNNLSPATRATQRRAAAPLTLGWDVACRWHA